MLRLGLVAVLGLATVIILPLYNREAQALRADAATLKIVQGIVQERLDQNAGPALAITVPGEAANARFREAYVYNRIFDIHAAERGVAIVACLRNPIMGLLKRDGRNVLLYDGEKLELRWFDEDDFRELAAQQNLDINVKQ